jgi:hypothetical protein
VLQQRAGEKQQSLLGDMAADIGPREEQLVDVDGNQNRRLGSEDDQGGDAESKARAGKERWKKIRGSVRYHATLAEGVKGFDANGNEGKKGASEGEIFADGFSSKEAPPESNMVPVCFAKSKMYRGWLYDFEDDE